jgi:hypothetical protein
MVKTWPARLNPTCPAREAAARVNASVRLRVTSNLDGPIAITLRRVEIGHRWHVEPRKQDAPRTPG